MTRLVTQCPHCTTSFRISRDQLDAAHGVVRCGACLMVFNAEQHLLDAQTPPPPAARPKTSAKPDAPMRPEPPPAGRPAADSLWIHDELDLNDLDLDNLDLDAELARLERQELQLSPEFQQLKPAPEPGQKLLQADHHEHDALDESWAEELLRKEAPAAPRRTPEPEASEPPKTALFTPEARLTASPLKDSAGLSLPPLQENPPPPRTPERQEPTLSDPNDAYRLVAQESAPAQAGSGQREVPLFDIQDEPLQLDWQAPRRSWGRRLGWGLLSLLALLALIGQYVTYNFDELARQDRFRPWLARACSVAGCELPSKVDIDQIRSSNLVVRSHPEFNGALVVDAILYNRASFAQPFPLLELRFANLGGQPIASRRFRPSEYLSGELAGQTEMPPQVPIHIALDILDPGEQAVNYSLSFHSPE